MHRLCLIIPTKDRPFELERLFKSIKSQSILPNQIIMVDGGHPGIKWLADKYADLCIDYLQVLPPGLTRQRNAGLRMVREDITIVGFLDDDIVLEKGCLSNMLDFWERAPDELGGAGFNIINNSPPRRSWWTELVSLNFGGNKKRGSLLKSGRIVPYCPAVVTSETRWLCGGATVWRKKIFDKFDFDEWFAGYGIGEDLDFSYRVSKFYNLAVVADAKVQHLETGKRDYFFLAYVVAMNNIYFSSKHAAFSEILCILSYLKDGLEYLVYGILLRKKNTVSFGAGYIWAVLRRIFIGIHRVERQVKSDKPAENY